jgi:transposase
VSYPIRNQVEMRYSDLDSLLPEDHPVRAVWEYVESLDLRDLYEGIGSVEGQAGRPATDPRVLMALWIQATLEGIGSARALARQCERDMVYQWICGGVSVNHHTLADFRVGRMEVLDRLLSESVAALLSQGLVRMHRVAHDGLRTKANAGKGSFRGKESLERHLAQAREQVETLRQELKADPQMGTEREKAARTRAVRERQERVRRAREELEKAKKSRAHGKVEKENVSCSTTDPQARLMRMPSGGYAGAYNVQLTADTETQVILGVEVSQEGTDWGELGSAVKQLQRRYGRKPKEVLADGGFASIPDIHEMESQGIRVYAPPKKPTNPNRGKYEPWRRDSEAVAGWRRRMGTEEAKRIYRERASSIECVNAQMRNRGLRQFPVRGLQKVRAVTLWFALAHNLTKAIGLNPVHAT